MLGCVVALYATAIQKISTPTAVFHFDSVLPTSEFRLMYLNFFTWTYEKRRRRKIKGEHRHSHQCRSHHRHEATLTGVLAVLKTAVSVIVLRSTLLVLSIHSAFGGRTGNSVLATVNTGRFLSSPQDSLKALAFQTLVFLTNVTPVPGKVSLHTEPHGCTLRLFYTKRQKTPMMRRSYMGTRATLDVRNPRSSTKSHTGRPFRILRFQTRATTTTLQIHGQNWSPSRLAG